MTTTMLRRGMVFLLVLGMTLAMTVVPAFALATGSASLADDVFFAGTTSRLDVTVTNNATPGGVPLLQPGGSSIDAVQLLVDGAALTPQAVNENAPEGWTGSFNEMRGTVFYFADDDNPEAPIGPGESLEFNLPALIAPGSSDVSSDVIVQVSDDGGTTATNAGVLPFDIKILEVVPGSVTIIKPVTTQAANLVTEQQDNADIRLQVRSYADTTKSVTASASKDGGSSTVTADSLTKNVGPGQVATFRFDAVFGGPGSLSILGEATASNAVAVPDTFSGITVQQAVALAFNNDLDPLAAVPGTTETFTLSVGKSGGPGADLDSEFSFAGLSDNGTITPGVNTTTEDLSYSVAIPLSVTDGEHPATLTYGGVDTNGALIDDVTLNLDNILLDRLQPVLDLVLSPPAAAVEGAEDAAGSSDTVGVSGTVTAATGGSCDQCDVINEVVEFLDAGDNVLGSQPGPNLTNNNGTVSGSFSMPADVPAGTVTVRLSADAQRADNLRVGLGRGAAEVDIVAPKGVDIFVQEDGFTSVDGSVTTTGRDEDGDFIDVPFTELIGFGEFSSAGDWTLDGNVVESVEYIDGSIAGTAKVRLRLAQELGRNDTPTVNYVPVFGPLARGFDRVELDLADQALEAIDNIAPDVLGIVSVSTLRGKGTPAPNASGDRIDQGSFGGVFYTRDRTPVVTVNNVATGDTVRVFQDNNGDGVQQGGERLLGQVLSAAGTTVEVTLNDLGNSEQLINISAYAIDSAGNSGLGSVGDELELEFLQPTIVDFTRTNNTVTVTFSEPVPVGRDAAFDWLVLSGNRYRPVDAVTNDGDDTTRTLTINPAVVPNEVDAVRYESITADTSDDYADRARNEARADGLEYTK